MEKINIAELLRDCPKDMELDCTMYEDVYFNYVDELNIIHCYIQHKTCKSSITFNRHGTPNMDIKSKCVIFPKGKTTWEGFIPPFEFKDGDVVATNSGMWIGITTGGKSGELMPTHCVIKGDGRFEAYLDVKKTWCFSRFATEQEKEKLFKAIKENGYEWNEKTKTLEELIESKFKIEKGKWYVCTKDLLDNYANKAFCKGDTYLSTQDGSLIPSNSNVPFEIYCASEYFRDWTINDAKEPTFKVGDRVRGKYTNNIYEISRITPEGYELTNGQKFTFSAENCHELVPDKFDINTLIPFESKVLVRHNKDSKWTGSFFSFIDRDFHSHCYKFVTTADKSYPMMIPFKGNEYLLGKTDDCQDFYKTWE